MNPGIGCPIWLFWRKDINEYIHYKRVWILAMTKVIISTYKSNSVSTALGVNFFTHILNDTKLIFDPNLGFHLGFVGISSH